MAGRGRGGKSMSLNVEALGFGRGGDAMPTAMIQPPPLFPPLENQPLPIEKSEVVDYLVDLKRDFQFFMEESPYYLKLSEPKNDIKRYSDKYKSNGQPTSNSAALLISHMPEELQPKAKKKSRGKSERDKNQQAMNSINELEKKEGEETGGQASDDSDAEKSDAEEQNEEEIDDEEDDEEDNDYIQEYFDNGENFLDADDDTLDDGPVY